MYQVASRATAGLVRLQRGGKRAAALSQGGISPITQAGLLQGLWFGARRKPSQGARRARRQIRSNRT
jgi:hypothetical protein